MLAAKLEKISPYTLMRMPLASPRMGGAGEHMVRSIKSVLQKYLKPALPKSKISLTCVRLLASRWIRTKEGF